MAKQLLSSFGKRGDSSYTTTGVIQGLNELKVDIEDTAHLSKYFQVVEFNPVFTAGKNSISFNGSDFLKDGSEIKVEVIDSGGNSLYLTAPSKKANYVDIANFTVAIYIGKETLQGGGKVFLVGTTTKGEIVRWIGNVTINTSYQNVSRVRFYNAPYMEARPLLYPVIQNATGSQLSVEVTVSGSFWLEVQDSNGYYSPGNANFGGSLPTTAKIIVWAYSGTPNNRIDAFNSQMEGVNIQLHYNVAYTKLQDNPTIWQYRHFDETSTILDVQSTTTIQVDTVPLGPIAQLSSEGGTFTCSYTKVQYIRTSTTVPCTSTLIKNVPSAVGYMETHVNSDTFTASMVGESLTMKYSSLTLDGPFPPFDPAVRTSFNRTPVTASQFVIRAVTGSRYIHVDPFTYTVYRNTGFGYHPVAYTASMVTGSITVLSASNPYQGYVDAAGSASLMKKSYADIVYRNLDTFSGYVARHKLYARSNIYPGNFELIDDTVLGPSELLIDPITANKSFSTIGTFANQDHINQYWYASSASLNLVYSDKPMLNSMVIRATPDYSAADGNSYVITKAGAVQIVNDEHYYPYDAAEFNEFSGVGYTSNYIFLAQSTLYMLSANVIINKNLADSAKVMFFFTSSIPSITTEKTYTPPFGYKLGEIVVNEKVKSRVFSDAQQIFFTPLNDYYGTLLIVPVNCEVVLSNVSMKNYGDYGYSPQVCTVQIPFPINIANEKWTLKSELFDSNYNLIYTLTPIVQAFDPAGASLFGSNYLGSSGGSGGVPSTLPSLTLTDNLYVPNITIAKAIRRFMAYNIPQHYPPLSGEGSLGYTQVSDVSLIPTNDSVTTKDYINVVTEEGDGQHTGRAIALRYSGSTPSVFGRRVYVDPMGVKTTYL